MFYYRISNGTPLYIYEAEHKKHVDDVAVEYPLDKSHKTLSYFDMIQQENKLLKAQLQAQTERSDFIEDCIAEMAGVVYNTEETTT